MTLTDQVPAAPHPGPGVRRHVRGGHPLDRCPGRKVSLSSLNYDHTASIFRGGVTAGGGDRMTGDSIALLSAALSGLMQVSVSPVVDGIKRAGTEQSGVKNAWSS